MGAEWRRQLALQFAHTRQRGRLVLPATSGSKNARSSTGVMPAELEHTTTAAPPVSTIGPATPSTIASRHEKKFTARIRSKQYVVDDAGGDDGAVEPVGGAPRQLGQHVALDRPRSPGRR